MKQKNKNLVKNIGFVAILWLLLWTVLEIAPQIPDPQETTGKSDREVAAEILSTTGHILLKTSDVYFQQDIYQSMVDAPIRASNLPYNIWWSFGFLVAQILLAFMYALLCLVYVFLWVIAMVSLWMNIAFSTMIVILSPCHRHTRQEFRDLFKK